MCICSNCISLSISETSAFGIGLLVDAVLNYLCNESRAKKFCWRDVPSTDRDCLFFRSANSLGKLNSGSGVLDINLVGDCNVLKAFPDLLVLFSSLVRSDVTNTDILHEVWILKAVDVPFPLVLREGSEGLGATTILHPGVEVMS